MEDDVLTIPPELKGLLDEYDAWCTKTVLAGKKWWDGFDEKLASEDSSVLSILERYVELAGYPPSFPYLPRLEPKSEIIITNGERVCQ